jgi:hypothetical protein
MVQHFFNSLKDKIFIEEVILRTHCPSDVCMFMLTLARTSIYKLHYYSVLNEFEVLIAVTVRGTDVWVVRSVDRK